MCRLRLKSSESLISGLFEVTTEVAQGEMLSETKMHCM